MHKFTILAALVFCLVFSSLYSVTTIAGVSAKRAPEEDYRDVAARTWSNYLPDNHSTPFPYPLPRPDSSAFGMRQSFSRVPLNNLPQFYGSYDALVQVFRGIRDERFLSDPDHSNFQRRITWLYPDDGCYARADLVAKKLVAKGYTLPAKIFAFGNLSVSTANSSTGSVTWWYHVVSGYRMGNAVYVFDPAIDPRSPLTLQAWVGAMNTGGQDVMISLCKGTTRDPYDDCNTNPDNTWSEAVEAENSFLNYEWSRMLELGRNPELVLGRNPPWL